MFGEGIVSLTYSLTCLGLALAIAVDFIIEETLRLLLRLRLTIIWLRVVGLALHLTWWRSRRLLGRLSLVRRCLFRLYTRVLTRRLVIRVLVMVLMVLRL